MDVVAIDISELELPQVTSMLLPTGQLGVVQVCRSPEQCKARIEHEIQNGVGGFLGAHYLWPLMLQVPEFIKDNSGPRSTQMCADDYRGRILFLIEKCDNERGLSAPKAWGQCLMFRWLFGWELDSIDFDIFPGFTAGAQQGHTWLEELGKSTLMPLATSRTIEDNT